MAPSILESIMKAIRTASSEMPVNDGIADKARRHLVQPWPTVAAIGNEVRTLLTRSEGIYVFDENERRLIDGPAGMWCVQIGHRRARWPEPSPSRS